LLFFALLIQHRPLSDRRKRLSASNAMHELSVKHLNLHKESLGFAYFCCGVALFGC
jgi:hypothetical protein